MTPTLRIAVRAPDAAAAERACAEAWAAGIVGVEERTGAGGVDTWLDLYVPVDRADAVAAALVALDAALEVRPAEAVEEVDWAEAWKEGLDAIEVSPRLRVRPSFVDRALVPGQRELVVDPGRAFGTGAHASTRLALEWVDALSPGFDRETSVLDVGVGTGVLALAALRLGAGRAVGFDLDPLAAPEARRCAANNELSSALALFTGPIDAVAGARFDLVLANLLRSELLPIADGVAAALADGGRLVLSGLLVSERDAVISALARRGLACEGERTHRDETGDHWLSLLMSRPAPRPGAHASRRGGPARSS